MKKRIAALALAASLAAPLAIGVATSVAKAATYPINPGYWEATYNWLGLYSTTDRYCVAPQNITTFLAKPCNHIYHCNYPVADYKDGKAHFEGTIAGNNELYYVDGGGTYTPTDFDMHAVAHGHWKFVPVPHVDLSIKGHFLGDSCPADAKRFHQRS
jgi:hypothetical protein